MTNLEENIFQPLPNYEECYLVSKTGEVRGIHTWNGKGKMLKPSVNIKGYLKVKLQKRCVKYSTFVHRLVAITFIPNPLNLPQVNHKDGNKQNNHVDNLEWCTNQENIDHRQRFLYTEEKKQAFRISCKNPERLKKISEASKGANNGFAKKVIDKSTGEIFGCVGDAAIKYGYTYNQLKQWLNGRRKNLSTLTHYKPTAEENLLKNT